MRHADTCHSSQTLSVLENPHLENEDSQKVEHSAMLILGHYKKVRVPQTTGKGFSVCSKKP